MMNFPSLRGHLVHPPGLGSGSAGSAVAFPTAQKTQGPWGYDEGP